jgi:squalene-hopene/tetraprenyl-beta-curcumene cyclase
VPDCDDTPGAVLATIALNGGNDLQSLLGARRWIMALRNRDMGFPTFCRGWGRLPFDRSGADLTAHAIRAIGANSIIVPSIVYLSKAQRSDGSWLPLWFGSQNSPDDENPVFGTARVLAAFRDVSLEDDPCCHRGIWYLVQNQNDDGGWGGIRGSPSTVEETSAVLDVLVNLLPATDLTHSNLDLRPRGLTPDSCEMATARGLAWLVDAVETGRFRDPSPIGFYFAKLWYYEKLYPLVFTVAALGQATRALRQTDRTA